MKKPFDLTAYPPLDRVVRLVRRIVRIVTGRRQILARDLLLGLRERLVNSIFEEVFEHVQVDKV